MINFIQKNRFTRATNYAIGLVALCAVSTTVSAQTEDEALRTFFADKLAGVDTDFTLNVPVNFSQIKSQQSAVWNAWVNANKELDEERLIEMENLSLMKSGKWNLPSELEPNAVMNYYFGKKGERPAEGYPLFMYLHGSGDPAGEWSNGINFGNRFNDGPSVYFIPQIPNTGDYYRWWQKAKQWAWEKMLRQAYLTGDIDPNRIYFFGISEGGYGSQRLASFYADYLAGAGPMAGGEPLKNAPVENCRNIAFNLRTGALDDGFYRNKLTGYTADAFAEMKEKYPDGFIHHIELIPGYGHQIDYTKTTPWLANHVRDPYPKHVIWENFEMDGLYRKGFYNIVVEDESRLSANSRITYFMDIEGNNVTLAVKKTAYQCIETDPVHGIQMKFKKFYGNQTQGKVRIYLNQDLVNMSRPVTITVNGKVLFRGMLKPTLGDMARSLATFYDPERIYPASVLIDLSDEETGIKEVTSDLKNETYYDISGRAAENPKNGVYITSSGRKVMF